MTRGCRLGRIALSLCLHQAVASLGPLEPSSMVGSSNSRATQAVMILMSTRLAGRKYQSSMNHRLEDTSAKFVLPLTLNLSYRNTSNSTTYRFISSTSRSLQRHFVNDVQLYCNPSIDVSFPSRLPLISSLFAVSTMSISGPGSRSSLLVVFADLDSASRPRDSRRPILGAVLGK